MAVTPSTEPSDGSDNNWAKIPDLFALPNRQEILKIAENLPPIHRIDEAEALTLMVPGTMRTPRGALLDIHTVFVSRRGIAAIHVGDIPALDWIGLRMELNGSSKAFRYTVNAIETEKIGNGLYRSIFLFDSGDTSSSR